MREQVKDKGRLEHILESIENLFEFTKDVDFEQFITNKLLNFAVIKNIENIGEAGYKLTKEFKKQHPEIRWEAIIKMRHVLVHDYYQIKNEVAWDVIQEDLATLQKQIKEIYENME